MNTVPDFPASATPAERFVVYELLRAQLVLHLEADFVPTREGTAMARVPELFEAFRRPTLAGNSEAVDVPWNVEEYVAKMRDVETSDVSPPRRLDEFGRDVVLLATQAADPHLMAALVGLADGIGVQLPPAGANGVLGDLAKLENVDAHALVLACDRASVRELSLAVGEGRSNVWRDNLDAVGLRDFVPVDVAEVFADAAAMVSERTRFNAGVVDFAALGLIETLGTAGDESARRWLRHPQSVVEVVAAERARFLESHTVGPMTELMWMVERRAEQIAAELGVGSLSDAARSYDRIAGMVDRRRDVVAADIHHPDAFLRLGTSDEVGPLRADAELGDRLWRATTVSNAAWGTLSQSLLRHWCLEALNDGRDRQGDELGAFLASDEWPDDVPDGLGDEVRTLRRLVRDEAQRLLDRAGVDLIDLGRRANQHVHDKGSFDDRRYAVLNLNSFEDTFRRNAGECGAVIAASEQPSKVTPLAGVLGSSAPAVGLALAEVSAQGVISASPVRANGTTLAGNRLQLGSPAR